ncbi:MAG: Rod shape-determining protein MreD [Cytophagales bacterium]|nr:MAG: Rod shape-determining protein MreD [Cytophagales bacterium]
MSQRSIFTTIGNFFVYLFLQIVIFKNFNILDTAYCFVYINFILLLPFEFPPLLIILLAFGYGFVIDIFYNTLGIHMSASVLLGFLRLHMINLLTPRGGYDASSEISLSSLGLLWMTYYCLILTFFHHLFLFFLEAWGFASFGTILAKTVSTSLLTIFTLLLFQYLFSPIRKKSS